MSLGETQREDRMSNLVEKYGTDWFRSKFSNSYFMYKGIPARVTGVNRGDTDVALAIRKNGQVKEMKVKVPFDYFESSSVFNVPELGYRHIGDGRWLGYVSRNNGSYHRGISPGNTVVTLSDHSNYLASQGVQLPRPQAAEMCNMLLEPTFIPFHKGIALMLRGDLMAFATSPTIAVIPDPDSEGLLVKMCSKVIGTVSPEGEMNITTPVAKGYLEESVCKQ